MGFPSENNYGSPVSGGKKDDELFLCHRLHRFSPIFLLKSAQIREIRGCGFCFPVKNGRT
jgi:hypothetical protein